MISNSNLSKKLKKRKVFCCHFSKFASGPHFLKFHSARTGSWSWSVPAHFRHLRDGIFCIWVWIIQKLSFAFLKIQFITVFTIIATMFIFARIPESFPLWRQNNFFFLFVHYWQSFWSLRQTKIEAWVILQLDILWQVVNFCGQQSSKFCQKRKSQKLSSYLSEHGMMFRSAGYPD